MFEFDRAINAMLLKAKECGIKNGALVVMKNNDIKTREIGSGYRCNGINVNSDDDEGINYLGFALGKACQSKRTRRPSSTIDNLRGESPATGASAWIEEGSDDILIIACSGGTEEQYMEVIKVGARAIFGL